MGITAMKKKITKRYMLYCAECKHLSFDPEHCENCGGEYMIETPKKYGLTNLACISMSVMDFEAMKQDFLVKAKDLYVDDWLPVRESQLV